MNFLAYVVPADMSESVTLSLSTAQRELIVEGLRYLRSSRRYEFRDPINPTDPRRDNDLREIAGLMTRIDPEAAAPRGDA
jgi:hypothetical protein